MELGPFTAVRGRLGQMAFERHASTLSASSGIVGHSQDVFFRRLHNEKLRLRRFAKTRPANKRTAFERRDGEMECGRNFRGESALSELRPVRTRAFGGTRTQPAMEPRYDRAVFQA